MSNRYLVFTLTIILLTGLTAAYQSETGDSEDEESNILNDVLYDKQAAYDFSNGAPSHDQDFSTYYGSEIIEEEEDEDPVSIEQDDGADEIGTTIFNYYLEPDGDWGGGEPQSSSYSFPNMYIHEDPRTGFKRGTFGPTSFYEACGSLTMTDQPFNCPEDSGLPDMSTTAETLVSSLTDNLGEFSTSDVEESRALDGSREFEERSPVYEPDEFLASEFHTQDFDEGTYYLDEVGTQDDQVYTFDSTGSFSDDSGSSVELEFESVPGFYIEGENDIHAKYLIRDFQGGSNPFYESIGSVETQYTTTEERNTAEEDSVSGCDDSGADMDLCHNPNDADTIYSERSVAGSEPELSPDSVFESIEGTAWNYYSLSSGGDLEISEGTNEVEFDIDVRNYQQIGSNDYYEVSGSTIEEEECNQDAIDICVAQSTTENCDCDDGPSQAQEGYSTVEDGFSYQELNSAEIEIKIERLEVADRHVFSLHPSNDPGILTSSVRESMFDDGTGRFQNSEGDIEGFDDIVAVSVDDQPYYSHTTGVNDFGDSNSAVSVSGFEIDTDSGDFVTERNHFSSFKPDGQDNLRNGYIAIEHVRSFGDRCTSDGGCNVDWFEITGGTDGILESGETIQLNSDDLTQFTDHEEMIKNQLIEDEFDCPEESLLCVLEVDPYIQELGTADENDLSSNWAGTIDGEEGFNIEYNAVSAGESFSLCKLYDRIAEDSPNPNSFYKCEYTGGGGGSDPVPGECTQAYNNQHNKSGPAVNDDVHDQDSDDIIREHFESCVEVNECVLHGEAVSEGTMANIAEDFGQYPATGYEKGEDSPDWNVCLNINDEYTYENYYEENPLASEFGGQWYDLDDPIVGEYLRGETEPHSGFDEEHQGDEEGLVEGADTSGRTVSEGDNHIEYFWRENPFPQHDTYNPEGGMEGTALLADCAPNLDGCADDTYNIEDNGVRGGLNDEEGVYFSFFEPGSRIEDYNPRGVDEETEIEPLFNAVLTEARKHSDNNQLGPGSYDYSIYNPDEFNDTEIGSPGDWESVAYAYAVNESWTVDSAGRPFPAYGAEDATGVEYVESDTGSHTIPGVSERDSPSDDGIQKTEKAFGNSLAVIASSDAENDPDLDVEEGQGYWIDPDNLREHAENGLIKGVEPGTDDWKDLVSFTIDITGPDSGLGWDYSRDDHFDYSRDASRDEEPHESEIETLDGWDAIATDIHWEGEDTQDGMDDSLQPPMCGDDHGEFLIEEVGETINSELYDGRYACAADSREQCVSYEGGESVLYEVGETLQTNEPGEDQGRSKEDLAVCAEEDGDDIPHWYDQDYNYTVGGTQVSQTNTLWGSLGVRWIGEEEINEHPLAFTGGIDDSWNDRMDQRNQENLTSDPDGENWDLDDGPIEQGYTPVPTGTDSDLVAVATDSEYGFTAGDDRSEYLIHQSSQSEHINTNQSVRGVALSPDSCVLDNSEYSNIDSDVLDMDHFTESELQNERMLYQEGDSVTFGSGDTRRTVACFGGEWWSEWPITFLEETASTDLGETGFTTFRVINPDDSSKTFDLGITPRGSGEIVDDLDQMVSFESTGTNDMTVTVPAQSSNTYRLEIDANREIDTRPDDNGEDIEVFAQSSDGSLDGEDQVDIEVVDSAADGQGQTRSIPGLTIVQLAVIVAISSLLFFRN